VDGRKRYPDVGVYQDEISQYSGRPLSLHFALSLQDETVEPIKRLVRSHVKEATLLSNVGAELSFQLPNDSSGAFQAMLTEIDARQADLGIDRQGRSFIVQ